MTFRDEDDSYDSEIPLDGTDIDQADEVHEDDDSKPSSMRETLSAQAAEIKALKQQLEESSGAHRADTMQQAFKDIGLDPNHGVGKAIAVTFDGEPGDLAQFAEDEFEHVAVSVHEAAAGITDGHARLDMIAQTAGSIPVVPTEQGALAKAEEAGDYATTMQIKSQQMAKLLRP
jgi:hypothetical protein